MLSKIWHNVLTVRKDGGLKKMDEKKEVITTPEEAEYYKHKHILESQNKSQIMGFDEEGKPYNNLPILEVSQKSYERWMDEKKVIKEINDWKDIEEIEKFIIFEGAEKIYEIYIDNKKIRLEGKEIMDYNIFRLKFFETFGVMLPTFRGIITYWSKLVTTWRKKYGKVEIIEEISESEEAKDMIIDYINACSVVDGYIVKEGVITLRDKIYVPTKIIKKLLKRENINITLRKLAYLLNDYISAGSIPLKIENRSERFWKFNIEKFNVKDKKIIELEKEEEHE